MGYYDGSPLPMWKLAQEYALADNFFMGAFGDSFLNHFWLDLRLHAVRSERADEAARASSIAAAGSSAPPTSPCVGAGGTGDVRRRVNSRPTAIALTTNQPP